MKRQVRRMASKIAKGGVLEYIELGDWFSEVDKWIAFKRKGEEKDTWQGLVLLPNGNLVPASQLEEQLAELAEIVAFAHGPAAGSA